MGDKINNFNTMMKNPKSRNIYLGLAGLGLVTLVVGFYLTTRTVGENTNGASVQVTNAPTLSTTPGSSDSHRYNEMVQKNNEVEKNKAIDSGAAAFVPTIVNNQFNAASPIDLLSLQDKSKREKIEIEEQEAVEREAIQKLALENLPPPPPPPIVVPIVETPIVIAPAPPLPPPPKPKKYSDDDYLLIGLLQATNKNYPPTSEKDYYGQAASERAPQAQDGVQTTRPGMSSQGYTQSSSANMSNVKVPDQKAGDIIHAVLDTGINSSEPSPILATVVSGQFKGAKLLGRFTKSGKKVVLQFNTISIPNYPTSVRLSAVAMDPDTRRSSMATDVDNHYFLRYGVLLASSFLSGYAGALGDKNTTTIVTPEGGVIETKGNKTNKDINMEALGNVGSEIASETKGITAGLEPTIYVDAGTAIGILFMDDFFTDGVGNNSQSAARR